MVRDEEDVIVPLVEHLFLQGVTRLIIADNVSVDQTRPLLEDLAKSYNIKIVDDPVVGYYQSLKMSALAKMAFDEGCDWILPCDADEVFTGTEGRTIAEGLAACPCDVTMALGYDYIARHEDDWSEPNPFVRITHRRTYTQKMGKVAFKANPNALVHQGNHGCEHPGPRLDGFLQYAHMQYRSLEQMIRKGRNGAQAYEASTLDSKHGTHWRRLGGFNDEEITDEWNRLCEEPDLVYDPCPLTVKEA